MGRGVKSRRACWIVGVSKAAPYRKPRPDRNARLKERLAEIARPGTGYRQAWMSLRSEFAPLNPKRVHRLWKELKLGLKAKCRKRRTGKSVPTKASRPNEVWSLDFVHDSCMNGTRLKILGVVDEFTRECLALEAGTSIKSRSVQAVLALLTEERGAPAYLRSDNGPEFVARSLALWLAKEGVESRFIEPGSPWQNGFAESFNSRLRAEFLNAEAFLNLADAQVKSAVFRRFYNEERPHSSLGGRTPAQAAREWESGRASPSLDSHSLVLSAKGEL